MTSRTSIRLPRARLAAVMGASLLLSLIAVGPVSATHVNPVLKDGNPNCTTGGQQGEGLGFDHGVKIDPPAEGQVDVGPGTVTISDIDTSVNPATFTWTSEGVTVLAVIVKGGSNANVYFYNPPPTTTDDGLHAPNGFSHIEICYNDEPPPDGSLKITKDLEGGPEGFSGSVDITVDCGSEGTFEESIDFPDGELVIDDLEPGTECEVTEVDAPNAPDGFEWDDVTYTNNPATIESGATVTIGIVNHLNEIPETPTLVIEKSNDAPGVGEDPLESGDTVGFKLDYTLTNGPVDDGIIEDVLPAGLTYVTGSATDSANGEFVFDGYDAATRTLTWLATEVTENGSVTYEATVDEGAAELQQPLTNTACIDSADTEEDCAESDVFVGEPPLAETAPPGSETAPPTDVAGSTDSGPTSGSLLLTLLALAGLALAVVFVAPTPAAIRKRMR